MVDSSERSARAAPLVKVLPSTSQQRTSGRSKPTLAKLNETGTLLAERVHVREIVVIPLFARQPDQVSAFRLIACR
jgi:hypothetical protein